MSEVPKLDLQADFKGFSERLQEGRRALIKAIEEDDGDEIGATMVAYLAAVGQAVVFEKVIEQYEARDAALLRELKEAIDHHNSGDCFAFFSMEDQMACRCFERVARALDYSRESKGD